MTHIKSMLWNFSYICISVFSPWIWAHHRKPFVPRHSQSLPGARWNQKAFELHARQSSRWAAQFFGQSKIFYWSILTWNTCVPSSAASSSSSCGFAPCSVHPEQLPQRPWITLKERDQMTSTGGLWCLCGVKQCHPKILLLKLTLLLNAMWNILHTVWNGKIKSFRLMDSRKKSLLKQRLLLVYSWFISYLNICFAFFLQSWK